MCSRSHPARKIQTVHNLYTHGVSDRAKSQRQDGSGTIDVNELQELSVRSHPSLYTYTPSCSIRTVYVWRILQQGARAISYRHNRDQLQPIYGRLAWPMFSAIVVTVFLGFQAPQYTSLSDTPPCEIHTVRMACLTERAIYAPLTTRLLVTPTAPL
jgi:hypothetical protein